MAGDRRGRERAAEPDEDPEEPPRVAVVLDSNAAGVRPFGGGAVRLLVEAHRAGQFALLCPQVVRDELTARWTESCREAFGRLDRVSAELRRLGVSSRPAPSDLESAVDEMGAELAGLLADAGIEILPLPSTLHADLLARALQRAQPFDADGRAGYRDALIWESIIEIAPRFDEIILVSGDARAFAEGRQGDRLSEALAAEFAARVGDGVSLKWVQAPRAVGALLGLSAPEAMTAARDILRARHAEYERVLCEFGEFGPYTTVPPLLSNVPIDPDLVTAAVDAPVSSAVVTLPTRVVSVQVEQARRLDDHRLLTLIATRVEAHISASIPAADFACANRLPSMLSWSISVDDDGEDRAGFGAEATLDMIVEATLDPASRTIGVNGESLSVVACHLA